MGVCRSQFRVKIENGIEYVKSGKVSMLTVYPILLFPDIHVR